MPTHQMNVGVAFCTPMPVVRKADGSLGLKHITVEFMRYRMSLHMGTNIQFFEIAVDGKEIGDARNYAASRLEELKVEYLFFLDSDVLPPFNAFKKLMKRAKEFPDYDIFSGVYCTKGPDSEPLLYMQNGTGPHWDWAVGDLVFEPHSIGMGCCLIRADLFKRLDHTEENPWFLTNSFTRETEGGLETHRGTEDIHFCKRAIEEAGAKILVDTSVLCGHQDLESGITYGLPADSKPIKGAKWMQHHEGETEELKAIDLGHGSDDIANLHPEYKWYTLDIRPGIGVDYVQDMRGLNFPDDHWDMVFSAHAFEHIGRWEQEKVWSEAVRVCKPGGKLEIWVPNLQWAGAHLANGNADEHVLNVLYGAQEEHGYERNYNTHYFGYTPDIARHLAEKAGLEDIKIKTYKDDENLMYNLIIEGTKPLKEEVSTKEDTGVKTKNQNGDTEDKDDLLPVEVTSLEDTRELLPENTRSGLTVSKSE